MICGNVHQIEAMEDYASNTEKRGRKNTCLAAKAVPREASQEDNLTVSILGLSLDEQEKQAMEDIAYVKLEQWVMDFEAECDRQVSARICQCGQESGDQEQQQSQDGYDSHGQSCDGHTAMALGISSAMLAEQERETVYSTYGTSCSRWHSRGCQSTWSTSCSRSSSRKCWRSKWSLKKYNMAGKDVRRLTFYDRGINQMGAVNRLLTACPIVMDWVSMTIGH